MPLKLESLDDLGVDLEIKTEQQAKNRLSDLCWQCYAQTEEGSYTVIDKEVARNKRMQRLYRPLCSAPCLLAWMKQRKRQLRVAYWKMIQSTDDTSTRSWNQAVTSTAMTWYV